MRFSAVFSKGLVFLAAVALAAVGGMATARGANASGQNGGAVTFADAAEQAGITFLHDYGGSGVRFLIETVASGLAAADFDNDGHIDVYFVQAAATPGRIAERPLVNVLYRNLGGGSFREVDGAGGANDGGYGIGVSAADYDDDGFVDLYVTNFGVNKLYRNNGDGTFSEVGARAGVDDDRAGASTAWADVDADGDLDLYVTNYLEMTWDNHQVCGTPEGLRVYCNPDVYPAQADVLYVNQGDGTFVDGSAAAGVVNEVEGKGLGVVFADYDDDGDQDIYVANDGERNFLFVNHGDGTFYDDAMLAGVGFSEDGRAEAGMGTDWGDFDGDGRLDIVVTNLARESNSLYRNLGGAMFSDVTFNSGVGAPGILTLGFGVNWIDIDNDADLDLFVANGHIIDNVGAMAADVAYAQPNHLYVNEGAGRFTEAHARYGPGMALIKVARGSATADVDNDGDLDVLVNNSNQRADYLRNDGGNAAGNWIQLRLIGRDGNRQAIGARVTLSDLREDTAAQVQEVSAGNSYASSSPSTLHFGLGAAGVVNAHIRWPTGQQETVDDLAAGALYVIVEGRGVIAERTVMSR